LSLPAARKPEAEAGHVVIGTHIDEVQPAAQG
jgi:hypothetical protein